MKKILPFLAALLFMAACTPDPEFPSDSLSPYVVQEGSSSLYPNICGPWHCDSAFRPMFFGDSVTGEWERIELWESDNIRLNPDFTAYHNGYAGVWVIFDSFLTIHTPECDLWENDYGYDFDVVEFSITKMVMRRRNEAGYITYWSRPK